MVLVPAGVVVVGLAGIEAGVRARVKRWEQVQRGVLDPFPCWFYSDRFDAERRVAVGCMVILILFDFSPVFRGMSHGPDTFR